MAGGLNLRDVHVGNCDKKCKEKCNCWNCNVNKKPTGQGNDDENGVPYVLFDQAVQVLLRRLYAKNAFRPILVSLGGSQSVHLYRLFCLVREKGGFDSVSRGYSWGLIAKNLDLNSRFSSSLKMVYFNKFGDLDQWLDSTRKDWSSKKMSDECGRNLELLSAELEKRLRALLVDDVKLVTVEKKGIPAEVKEDKDLLGDSKKMRENEIPGGDQILDHIEVALKDNLHSPGVKEDKDLLGESKKMRENEANKSIGRQDPDLVERSKRKRKFEGCEEMLSWLKKIAKNPCSSSKGGILNSSKWTENGGKEFLSLARVAMLKRKYSNSDGDECCTHQKQKIHPSMYDDPASCHLPGIRFSKRVPALAKSPKRACCISSTLKECRMENHSIAVQTGNDTQYKEDKTPDSPASSSSSEQIDDPSPFKLPAKRRANVGRQFQAEIPPLTGVTSESDSKWLGTQVWPSDNSDSRIVKVMELVGKGRHDICNCVIPGSVECIRFHTMENNMKLKRELGRAFYQWKLDRMGEAVSLCWNPEEEEEFKSVMCSTPLSIGRPNFPQKTRQELVDYYFNVFLQRKRSYQNRVTPNAINSDDELSDFGSVAGLYGYLATHTSGSNPGVCTQTVDFTDVRRHSEGQK